ncbi:hypothetical protein D3C73_1040860 [compost metagenome]
MLQRTANIALVCADVHHEFSRIQLYGNFQFAKRRWVKTDGRHLLLLAELELDPVFQ